MASPRPRQPIEPAHRCHVCAHSAMLGAITATRTGASASTIQRITSVLPVPHAMISCARPPSRIAATAAATAAD